MSWFDAIGNVFETRSLARREAELRSENQRLEQAVAALQAENAALKKQVAEFEEQQSRPSGPLQYPDLGLQ